MSSVICFGAAHWDVIARARTGTAGKDRPGEVETRPGGVALNVASALVANGIPATLVAPVGGDEAGAQLLSVIRGRGIDVGGMVVRSGRATGRYVAVEEADGELLHAIADDGILETMTPGRIDFGNLSDASFWMAEANLSEKLLCALADQSGRPPLAVNPVSEAKARRLLPVLSALEVLYCNRREAEVLCADSFPDSITAASALREAGVARAVVTDGAAAATDAGPAGTVTRRPPALLDQSVTGAGDAFMAGHLAAVVEGAAPEQATENGFTAVNRRGSCSP